MHALERLFGGGWLLRSAPTIVVWALLIWAVLVLGVAGHPQMLRTNTCDCVRCVAQVLLSPVGGRFVGDQIRQAPDPLDIERDCFDGNAVTELAMSLAARSTR